MNYVIKTTIKY